MSAHPFKLAPVALASALALAVGVLVPAAALAQSAPSTVRAEATFNINLPAQPLGNALNELARQAGLQLLVRRELVEGKQAPSVSGRLTARQALDRLLAGSGLLATTEGASVVVRAMPMQTGEATLPTVAVTATAEPLSTDLSPPYSGGELARGATIGVLGTRDLFELPASIKSFTEQSMRDRIAFTSNDVVSRDASFTGTGDANLNGSTAGRLRGFRIEPFESTFDGFSSIASRRYPVEFLERVEILKGPSTIFTGAIGGVGGTINYVSKKPLEEDLSRATVGFSGNSQLGASADLSRRFGEDGQFGLRLNLAQRDGETSIDGVDEKSETAHIAFNWRNEVANLDVQYGRLEERIQGASGGYFFGTGIEITPPPKGSRVGGPAWDDRSTRDSFLRAALDVKLTRDWSAFAVLGSGTNRERYFGLGSPSVIHAAGDANSSPFVQNGDSDTRSVDLGIRGKFNTGTVGHSLTLSYSQSNGSSDFQDRLIDPGYTQPPFNIYDPGSYAGPAPGLAGSGQFFPFSETKLRGVVLVDELSLLEDRLKITAGVRHTRFDNAQFAYGAATPGGLPSSTYKASDTSPSFGALYKFTPQFAVYGNYLKAIESASTAPVRAVNAGTIIPPGVATQREVGAKFDLGGFGLSTALFQIERPSTYVDPTTLVFGQFGRNRHRGLEIDVFGEPIKGVRTQFSYTYLDAEVLRNQNPVVVGNRPVSVPRNVLVFSADADVPGVPGLAAMAGVRFVGSQFYDLTNQRSIPSFTVVDAGVRYSFKSGNTPMVLRLSISNLFDKSHYQYADFTVQSGAPRTLKLALQADF